MNTTTNTILPEAIVIHLPEIEARYTPGDSRISSLISLDIIDEDSLHIRHVHAIIEMLQVVYPEASENVWFELEQRPEIYGRLVEEDNEWRRSLPRRGVRVATDSTR